MKGRMVPNYEAYNRARIDERSCRGRRKKKEMKAYRTWDEKAFDPCATIVFAKNIKEAKKIATATDTCEDANFIDIGVRRLGVAMIHHLNAKSVWRRSIALGLKRKAKMND